MKSKVSHVKEEWRPIIGWENLYEVSNLGRVRSKRRTILRKRHATDPDDCVYPWRFPGKILHPVLTGSSPKYRTVHLHNQTRRESVMLSHLVVSAFLDRPVSHSMVRSVSYLDDDPANCALSNLKYTLKSDTYVESL